MITRDDLFTTELWVDPVDGAEWRHVMYEDDRYILVASDMKDEDYEKLAKHFLVTDVVGSFLLGTLPKEEADELVNERIEFLKSSLPPVDVAVFRSNEKWEIEGECGDECASGVCSKRLASRTDGNIDTAYAMLVDYINA